MMKLYGVPAAPNPTKVMLYLAEREAKRADRYRTGAGEHIEGRAKSARALGAATFGALPTLELDNGQFIVESLAIIYFLEDLFPEGALQPAEPVARGLARDMERNIETRFANNLGRYVHAVDSPLGLPKDPRVASELRQLCLRRWPTSRTFSAMVVPCLRATKCPSPTVRCSRRCGCAIWQGGCDCRLGRDSCLG